MMRTFLTNNTALQMTQRQLVDQLSNLHQP